MTVEAWEKSSSEKSQKARYMYFRGDLELSAGRMDAARKYFEKSISHWPDPGNHSFEGLAKIYESHISSALPASLR